MAKSKILLTGANGFIGQALLTRLHQDKWPICCVLRSKKNLKKDIKQHIISLINDETDWTNAVKDCSIVVHLIGRSNLMKNSSKNSLAELRKINVDLTINLAKQAAISGVKRFVFLSSVKVNGELSLTEPFKETSSTNLQDAYAISKFEAEAALRDISKNTNMEVVIIRPPLVYGKGVKGNFLNMVKWLKRPIFLPFGSVNNLRSFIGIDNLVDFIITCLSHSKAGNETFFVSDDEDISTTNLLKLIASLINKTPKLIPFPVNLIYLLMKLLGKKDLAQRLLGTLQVDISKAKLILGWKPKVSLREGLKRSLV